MQPRSSHKRGGIVLVHFPVSNLRVSGIRPAPVVQADNLQTGLAQVVVAMVTSQLHRANHSSRVKLFLSAPEGRQSGLHTESVVMTDNLTTVIATQIRDTIGMLPTARVDIALRHTLGL